MADPYRGSCLCGAIRFEVDGFGPEIAHCHCTMCRKFHGAAFATLATVDRSQLRWQSGEELLRSYTGSNKTVRQFCERCGSSLTFASTHAPPHEIEIALAAFDDPLPIEPDAHIFLDYRANWYDVTDDLTHFGEGRDYATKS